MKNQTKSIFRCLNLKCQLKCFSTLFAFVLYLKFVVTWAAVSPYAVLCLFLDVMREYKRARMCTGLSLSSKYIYVKDQCMTLDYDPSLYW